MWQLVVCPWPWLRQPNQLWGIDTHQGRWVQLTDFDQLTWQVHPLSWVTPWGALVMLERAGQPRRWLWLPRSWLGDGQYRRLARWLLRWRQYGRLRISG
ncbi:hypothetical protein SAMN02927930_00283 [Pseudidiomarina indica]|uniref:Toxin CptA n=1 Tax=Pseudidiomarina indica TaxID=1159017 RepID=A0A1G6AD30_9GAMM|nr:hypothetical protein [Pseudidiomarina indica]SDB06327.1 hypothetical protein SAMN02927930_00283 [Pseudidiomarina indica]